MYMSSSKQQHQKQLTDSLGHPALTAAAAAAAAAAAVAGPSMRASVAASSRSSGREREAAHSPTDRPTAFLYEYCIKKILFQEFLIYRRTPKHLIIHPLFHQ